MENLYIKHTDKYLDLLQKFFFYINNYNTEVDIPNKANIVIFDANDKNFSEYSLRVLDKLINKNEKNIVEVTKTHSKIIPWRISKYI